MTKAVDTVTCKTTEGEIYEAIRDDARAPWEISFPTGAKRFPGSKSDVFLKIAGCAMNRKSSYLVRMTDERDAAMFENASFNSLAFFASK